MEEELTKALRRILASVKILAPDSLLFAGEVTSPPVDETSSQQPPADPRIAMMQHLGQLLYLQCYCRRFTGEIDHRDLFSGADGDFVKQLSDANNSREHLSRGWHVIRKLQTGHFVAEKNGLTRLLSAGEFSSHPDLKGPVEEGTAISILRPRESTTMHPGFYFVYSEALGDDQDDRDLLRFYWNVTSEGATKIVSLLTRSFNRFQLPFRLKIVNNPAAYIRADAAVLYLNKRFYHLASELLSDVHKQITSELNPDTPLFSKKLARGLGLAEEPTTGESFGQQRCRILAHALWAAFEKKLDDEDSRLREISTQLQTNGIDAEFPYRNAGSNEVYEFRA
jgi:HopA1 effector protein family